jgi:hypothetical protein
MDNIIARNIHWIPSISEVILISIMTFLILLVLILMNNNNVERIVKKYARKN